MLHFVGGRAGAFLPRRLAGTSRLPQMETLDFLYFGLKPTIDPQDKRISTPPKVLLFEIALEHRFVRQITPLVSSLRIIFHCGLKSL